MFDAPTATPAAVIAQSKPADDWSMFDAPQAALTWDNPAAFGLTPAPAAGAAPVVAVAPAADPWDPAAFGLRAAPAPQPAPAEPAVDTRQTGYAANIAAGGNAAVAGALGFPVDLATGGINLATRGINAVTGSTIPQITDPVGGSGTFKRALGVIGANPDDVRPDGVGQELARGAAGGVVSAAIPTGAVSALARAGMIAEPAAAATLSTLGRFTPTNALLNAGAGAASDAASANVPERYAPLVGMVAGLGAGGAAATGLAGAQVTRNALTGLADATGMGTKNALLDMAGVPLADTAGAPIKVTKAQADAAATRFRSAASDPQAASDALNTATVNAVPAAPLTTYQVTGDQGLGGLERGVSQADNGPFIDLKNRQNAARVDALGTIPPADASTADIGSAFRQQLTALDAQHQAAVDAAMGRVRGAVGDMGPTPTGDAASAQQQFGQQMRDRLATANQAAKAREGELWNAVDPDGTLAVNPSAIRSQARSIIADHGDYATPLTGAEADILQQGTQVPAQMRFSDLKDYRSRITDAISQARMAGDNQTVRRLSQMLDGVHATLDGAVSGQAAQDAERVASGAMSPEQTMMARFKQWEQAELARNQAAVGAGNGGGEVSGAAAGSGATAYPGDAGAAGEAGNGPRGAPGTSGVSGQAPPLTPFDDAAAARYAQARQATADRNATYTNAPGVGAVLKPGRWAGDFRTPDSAVPGQLFTSGQGAAERVQAYLAAGGNPADLAGYAAFDMQRAAGNPDGTLNAARLQTWMNQRGEALSALPQLRDQLSTAAGAQTALDQARAARAQALSDYQASAAGKFLGDADPVKQVGSILGSNRAQAQMADLAARTDGDPAARAGIQRAVVDHVLSQMQGDKLAGQTGTTNLYGAQLQKFVRQKGAALAQVLTPAQMQVLHDVAANIQASDQSVGGNVLTGNSATVQNAAAVAKANKGATLLSNIVGAGGAGAGAYLFGPLGAGLGSQLGKALPGLQATNIKTVNDLIREAVLRPEVARVLLSRVTPQNASTIGATLAARLRGAAVTGAAVGSEQPSRPPLNALMSAGPPSSGPTHNRLLH
jgi:hypothetical protein